MAAGEGVTPERLGKFERLGWWLSVGPRRAAGHGGGLARPVPASGAAELRPPWATGEGCWRWRSSPALGLASPSGPLSRRPSTTSLRAPARGRCGRPICCSRPRPCSGRGWPPCLAPLALDHLKGEEGRALVAARPAFLWACGDSPDLRALAAHEERLRAKAAHRARQAIAVARTHAEQEANEAFKATRTHMRGWMVLARPEGNPRRGVGAGLSRPVAELPDADAGAGAHRRQSRWQPGRDPAAARHGRSARPATTASCPAPSTRPGARRRPGAGSYSPRSSSRPGSGLHRDRPTPQDPRRRAAPLLTSLGSWCPPRPPSGPAAPWRGGGGRSCWR